MNIDEEVIIGEGKDFDELEKSFESPALSEYERQEAERAYQTWANGSMGRNGRLSDEQLGRFMEGKLHNMQQIMKASDKLVSRNGHVSQKKEHPQTEETVSKKEYEELKDEIKDLKRIIMEKLS